MKHPFLRVVVFVIMVVALFIFVGESITSISGTGRAVGIAGELSEDAGEAIFFGKGKCYTCHAFGAEGSAVRCPNLGMLAGKYDTPVGVRAAGRKADEGMSAIQYLVESLYNPNAYIVKGYPGDLMKPINRPPIALNDLEIAAVVLYLISKSEVEIGDETIPEILAAQGPFASGSVVVADGGGAFLFPEGDAEEGRYAYEENRCYQCHLVEGVEFVEEAGKGGIGPDLTMIGSIQTRTYMVESLLDPNKVVVADPPGQKPGDEGSYRNEFGDSKMPEYHDTMTLRQLLDIAAFLETLQSKEENADLYGDY